MAKIADKYLEVHPWKIIEKGFHPDRSEVSESLFSLANEHMGMRGFFEEGYSKDSLVGVYLNGIYEEWFTEGMSYKGISNRLAFMVNTVNWLYTRIEIDEETLDLASIQFSDFHRQLDFRTGELERSFIWETASGKRLQLTFSRLLSMKTKELACSRISLTPLNFSGTVKIVGGLDFSIPHRTFGKNFWHCPIVDENAILGVSEAIGHRLFAGVKVFSNAQQKPLQTENFTGVQCSLDLKENNTEIFERQAILYTGRDPSQQIEEVWEVGNTLLSSSVRPYNQVLAENSQFWQAFWERSDIVIDGDPETQQGIRFCIFQMQQTYRGVLEGSNIGAKGLTGEAYNGNTFWDTETYCLPFYLFNNPNAAKSLINFRYQTLPQALARAKDLDCQGACFPVATSDGTESCTLWQHASLQFQPTTAVAYAIWHYVKVTGDTALLKKEWGEMLVQICRFLASRGQWSPSGQFGYYAVMGPDEFQMMVNNNAYTNYMAMRIFEYTLSVLAQNPLLPLNCPPKELETWKQMASSMILPYDKNTELFEQHEGFFNLPHIDVDTIPTEEFPLYHHWSYDRIYRNDMIKQPDVLMFMFLYNQSFSLAEKRANYEYYEPRCIHESSLSPSVHSILASELGKHQEAFEFFRFATRIDLDNYNRNTNEGIHTTSIAAAWMNIVYGFGGMRSDGEILSFSPSIPPHWKSFRFQVTYRGALLQIEVTQQQASFSLLDGEPILLKINQQKIILDQEEQISVPLQTGP